MESHHAWWLGRALQDRDSFRLATTAGLGSGKTHERCLWHFLLARENQAAPKSAELWPTYLKVIDAAIPTYQKVLESIGLKQGIHYHIVKSPFPKIKFPCLNGHEIHFLSAQHPERITASEYSHGSIDEAGIISGKAVQNFVTRVRDSRSKRRQILEVGAPQGVNDFADTWDSDTLPGWQRISDIDHYKDTEWEGRVIRMRRFKVWTDHNKAHLPPEYIPILMATYGHNQNLIRSLRFGEFCPWNEGAVYSCYAPQKDDIADIEADKHRTIDLSFDFNAAPLAWVAAQQVPVTIAGRRLFRVCVLHESGDSSSNLDDAVIEFALAFPVHTFSNTKIRIFGDSTGHAASHKIIGSDYDNIRKLLRQLGYKDIEILAMNHNPREVDSVEAVQRLFRESHLTICKRCNLLRRSLIATAWKKGVRKIDKPSGETWTHHSDALKYLIYTEYKDFKGYAAKQIYGINSY